MFAPCRLVAPEDCSPTAVEIETLIDAWRTREGEPVIEPEPVCERPLPRHRMRRVSR